MDKLPARHINQDHSKKGNFRAASYKGGKPNICPKLANLLRPAYGTNLKSFFSYETDFSSDTHNLVENRPYS